MLNAHSVLGLIGTYGYVGLFAAVGVGALGVGVPVPVTALLLTVGALSGAHGGPSFMLAAAAALAGVVVGHNVDYWCGRAGNRLLQRWLSRPSGKGGARALISWALQLRGGRAALVFFSRFLLTSIASPVSLLAGATRMAFGWYLCIEVSGEAIYVLGNLALGRIFGVGLLAHGVPLAFWLAVAALTLAPLALLRVLMLAFARGHPEERPLGSAAPSR